MGAVATAFDMTAQGGGPAGFNGAHYPQMRKGQAVAGAVCRTVLPEDVGQLERGPAHGSFRSGVFARPAALAFGRLREMI